MSRFGDGNSHMNYLYDNLEEFFNENQGTLEEFFEVLRYFFEEFKKKKKKKMFELLEEN